MSKRRPMTKKSRMSHKKSRLYQANPLLARVDQISDLLKPLLSFDRPADAVLSYWFKQQKQMGKRDRHEVAESVYHILRHLRLFRHCAALTQGDSYRLLAYLGLRVVYSDEKILTVLDEVQSDWFREMCTILPHSTEVDTLSNHGLSHLSSAVRYSFPDDLMPLLETVPNVDSLLPELNQTAPLDIRVNPLKINRKHLLQQLLDESLVSETEVTVTPYSPYGLRLSEKQPLQQWDIFKKGLIEVQDESSQLLCELVAPKRGEVVIDFCAGAGGKTLLMGAMMKSTGRLYAFDVSEHRLNRAKPRFARAGLSNVLLGVLQSENDTKVKRLAGKADRVLVDAPCSGMGTLRRNPDLKWRQSPEDIQELMALQSSILEHAARCVRVGGRLVYSTCSVLPCENEMQVEAFLARHSEFVLKPVQESWKQVPEGLEMEDEYLRLRPDYHGTDGFFAAVLERKE